jgi:hypothetical protein
VIGRGVTYLAAAGLAASTLMVREDGKAMDLKKLSSNFSIFTEGPDFLLSRNLVELPIGDLPLPDGKLVALDPLVQADRQAFTRTVKPGTYPVSFIRANGAYNRPGFIVIRFSKSPVTHFELALLAEQNPSTLTGDQFFGIPVDAGVAAFANSSFATDQAKREAEERRKAGDDYVSYYDDVLFEDLPGTEGDESVLHRPFENGEGAVAIAQSGWGDGHYPVFWGLDKDGKPALAFIELFVILEGDGRSSFDKRRDAILATMSEEQRADNQSAHESLEGNDNETFIRFLTSRKISPKDYALKGFGSFMYEAIRLDRPHALAAMMRAGADNKLGPYDELPADTYSEYARRLAARAEKARIEGKSGPALRSPELMAVIAELEKRPGGSDQPK